MDFTCEELFNSNHINMNSTGMLLQELVTERIILRPFRPQEVHLMQELDNDPEVVRFLGQGHTKTSEESEKNLQKIISDYQVYGLGLFAAFEKSSGQFIGRCGLIPWMMDDSLVWKIGYSLKKTFWGKGYATEAAGCLSNWAGKNLKISHVISLIHPGNKSSINVAEKIGMKSWKEITIHNVPLIAYKKEQDSFLVN